MNAFKWSWAMVMVAAPFASVSASWLDGRPYIGAGASYSVYDNLHVVIEDGTGGLDLDFYSATSIEKNTFGFGGFAGWTFPGNYSLEVSYVDFGEFDAEGTYAGGVTDKVSGKITGKGLGMRYDWPAFDAMSVYGRIGVMRWEATWDVDYFDVAGERTDSVGNNTNGSEFYIGVGGQYEIIRNLFGYVEVFYLDAQFDQDGFSTKMPIYSLTAGIMFRFGDVARPSGTTDKRTREVTACDPKYKDLSGIMCEQ